VAWLDVFCLELLTAWYQQHAVVEAQMVRAFDETDEVPTRPGPRGRRDVLLARPQFRLFPGFAKPGNNPKPITE
jgi:hypothetical protein